MSYIRTQMVLAFTTFILCQLECLSQNNQNEACYIYQKDSFWEMFVFKTTGDFVYKSGSTFSWAGIDGVKGEGCYSLSDNCKEIRIVGNPVAKLNKCSESMNDSVKGCCLKFNIYSHDNSNYIPGMFIKYILINNDTLYQKNLLTEKILYDGSFDSVVIFVSPNAVIKYTKLKKESNILNFDFDYCFEFMKDYFGNEVLYVDEFQCLHYKGKSFYKWPDSPSVCDVWDMGENVLLPRNN